LYWDKTHLREQEFAFREQITWAKELQLPIVIHARKAYNEIFNILSELHDERLRGVFHCFSENYELAKKALSFKGFKLGIGGGVTYKTSALSETLSNINLDNIVLETDSPYLSPVPHRGKRNESSYLVHVAEKLAEIYHIPLKEIAERTSRNARDLFGV
jgi:TatD DNase family protein